VFSQSACDPIVVCELRRGFDVSYVGAAHSLPTLPTGITKTRARPRRDAVRTGLPATSSRWAATHGADHGPGESKTTHLGFGLRTPEFACCRPCLFRQSEHGPETTRNLWKAQERLRRDVAIVRQDRRDHIDRAGTLLQRAPCVAIGVHAGEDIVGSRPTDRLKCPSRQRSRERDRRRSHAWISRWAIMSSATCHRGNSRSGRDTPR